ATPCGTGCRAAAPPLLAGGPVDRRTIRGAGHHLRAIRPESPGDVQWLEVKQFRPRSARPLEMKLIENRPGGKVCEQSSNPHSYRSTASSANHIFGRWSASTMTLKRRRSKDFGRATRCFWADGPTKFSRVSGPREPAPMPKD